MKKFLLISLLAFQTAILTAAVPVHKSIKEFLRMSPKDSTICELTGVISRVRNHSKGNVFIDDGTASVLIFGFRDREKRGMKELDIRKGDTLTVSGRRFVYDGRVIEMKYAWYVCHSRGPDHDSVPMQDELDENPTFRGKDISEFSKWVSAHLKYPEGTVCDGNVVVSFIVGMDGSIQEAKIVSGAHPALEAEALRVIRIAPKWKPGKVDGHTVRVTYTMPIMFIKEN